MARAPIGKHGRDHRVPGTLGGLSADPLGGHDPYPGVPVYKDGTWVTTEGGLDFEDTATVTWEVIDDPLNHRTIIKADAAGGGGGGGGGSFPGGAVQAISSVSASTVTTYSLNNGDVNAAPTTPTGIAAGDLLIVLLNSYQDNGSGLGGDISLTSIPAGWGTIFNYSLDAQSDSGPYKSVRACFWKFATGTEGSTLGPWTLHNATAGHGCYAWSICHAFRGTASAGQLGAFAALQTALTGSPTFSASAPSVASVPSGSLSIVTGTCPAMPPSATWTFPTGYSVASLNGPSSDVNTWLGWKLAGDGTAQAASVAGFSSLGTAKRYMELAQIIVYPALA